MHACAQLPWGMKCKACWPLHKKYWKWPTELFWNDYETHQKRTWKMGPIKKPIFSFSWISWHKIINWSIWPDRVKPVQFLSYTVLNLQGKRVRGLTVIDVFSKINHALQFDFSLTGFKVIQVLERVCEFEGVSDFITVDNGPEFICLAIDKWAYQKGIKLHFSRPGRPTDNAFIESFNGKERDEF